MQHTKKDWKAKAAKLAALWVMVVQRDKDEVTLSDILVFESLTATANSVAKMLRDEEALDEELTEEKLHEMMEQAAREICDE